jgi:hypothetical protein
VALVSRPLNAADLESLAGLEARYLERHGGAPLVSAASLRFYQRSGHAFVAERAGLALGFALGRTGWDGASATVSVERIAVDVGAPEALDALIAAVTKSAYDAGVYRIELRIPAGDGVTLERAQVSDYRSSTTRLMTRTLGSRGDEEAT